MHDKIYIVFRLTIYSNTNDIPRILVRHLAHQKHTIVNIYMNMYNGKLLKVWAEYYALPKSYVTWVWENIWLAHQGGIIHIFTLSLSVYFTLCTNGISATCIIEDAPRRWLRLSYLVYYTIGSQLWLVMWVWIYYQT